jgi:hypothetical protein
MRSNHGFPASSRVSEFFTVQIAVLLLAMMQRIVRTNFVHHKECILLTGRRSPNHSIADRA